MHQQLIRVVVGASLLGLGVVIGGLGHGGFENRADAETRRIGPGSRGRTPAGAGAVVSEPGGTSFPMTIYKGPNRTVKYWSAGRDCTALNVAEVLVYPGVMVFKDNRDVIGGTGLAALGQFSIIVGQ